MYISICTCLPVILGHVCVCVCVCVCVYVFMYVYKYMYLPASHTRGRPRPPIRQQDRAAPQCRSVRYA